MYSPYKQPTHPKVYATFVTIAIVSYFTTRDILSMFKLIYNKDK